MEKNSSPYFENINQENDNKNQNSYLFDNNSIYIIF